MKNKGISLFSVYVFKEIVQKVIVFSQELRIPSMYLIEGAQVVATDLEELIGNLQYNVVRNTKLKSKYVPQIKELTWGCKLEETFPKSSSHFEYILAADVVYNHPFLDELLETFHHLCQQETIILWAMKFRKENTLLQNTFFHNFQKAFDMEVIYDLPSLSIKLYKATQKINVH